MEPYNGPHGLRCELIANSESVKFYSPSLRESGRGWRGSWPWCRSNDRHRASSPVSGLSRNPKQSGAKKQDSGIIRSRRFEAKWSGVVREMPESGFQRGGQSVENLAKAQTRKNEHRSRNKISNSLPSRPVGSLLLELTLHFPFEVSARQVSSPVPLESTFPQKKPRVNSRGA
jgi:hypothetical protein